MYRQTDAEAPGFDFCRGGGFVTVGSLGGAGRYALRPGA